MKIWEKFPKRDSAGIHGTIEEFAGIASAID